MRRLYWLLTKCSWRVIIEVLFYSILFYSILFYSILFYSILFYSILFYSILFYSILFCRNNDEARGADNVVSGVGSVLVFYIFYFLNTLKNNINYNTATFVVRN